MIDFLLMLLQMVLIIGATGLGLGLAVAACFLCLKFVGGIGT